MLCRMQNEENEENERMRGDQLAALAGEACTKQPGNSIPEKIRNRATGQPGDW